MGKRKERIEWEKEKEALGQEKKGTASENERTLKREAGEYSKETQGTFFGTDAVQKVPVPAASGVSPMLTPL